ncbi:unnamed protein product [Amoebophrya sp. A25]|nr:unnamed protein product [Amoebophrya sp. A25]|eukprot:GSA25T00013032001.1
MQVFMQVFAFLFLHLPAVLGQATYPSEFKLEYCTPDGTCHANTFSCPHFQMRLWSYYKKKTHRLPLKEAWFLIGLPGEYRDELVSSCPGGMLTAAFLVAKASLYSNPERAGMYFQVGIDMLANKLPEVHRAVALDTWPVTEAHDEYLDTHDELEAAKKVRAEEVLANAGTRGRISLSASGDGEIEKKRLEEGGKTSTPTTGPPASAPSVTSASPPAAVDSTTRRTTSPTALAPTPLATTTVHQSLDLAIVHCRESLAWIANELVWPVDVLRTLRLFIYEKCDENGDLAGTAIKLEENFYGRSTVGNAETAQEAIQDTSESDQSTAAQQQLDSILHTRYNVTLGFGAKIGALHVLGLQDAKDQVTLRSARRDECSAYSAHVSKMLFRDGKARTSTYERQKFLWENKEFLADDILRFAQKENLNEHMIAHQKELEDENVLEQVHATAVSSGATLKNEGTEQQVIGDPDLGDFTIFLHGDPISHWQQFQYSYLNLMLSAMQQGRLDVRFLHLSTPRLVAVRTPCQDQVFRYVMGRGREGLLETYCCAQFLVSKKQLMSIPESRLERLQQIVDGSIPDLCERVGPTYEKYQGQRLSYCYSLEFMWHVILGDQPEGEPLRSDNAEVPFFLRWKDNEESYPLWRDPFSYYVMKSEFMKKR